MKEECCPKFETKRWDKKTFNWKKKNFLKETIPTFFHIPFPPMIGKRITKMYNLAVNAKADPPKKEWLVLFRDPTPFKSELYMSVTKSVKGANNVTISGIFMARVFEGPYNAVPKFIKEMNEYLSKKKKKAKDYYVHYAYCPGCAKKFGHNYMILFAKV
ncbi:hypothetical protein KY312_03425 [Candidatus Woesearchaeota archaeon]|nr:hypothetical protein [Candidatus Woesearchaeota archaeon]